MAIIGIDREKWNDIEEPEGFVECPEGWYDFEITKMSEGVVEKTGDEYMLAHLTCSAEDGKEYKKTEFLSLGDRIGWTKKFLLRIGRADAFESNFDTQELIGTQFKGSIKHNPGKDGKTYVNLDYTTLEPVSHTLTDMNAKAAPAPAKPVRGGKK